ncbi:MAG: formyltransferase family protein [Myxococcota bacterium]
MKILYLGLPIGALVLEAQGFQLTVAANGYRRAPGTRRVRRRLGRNALCLARPALDSSEVVAALRSADTDVGVTFFFPRRIPSAILTLPKKGFIGLHPSLLPRWRGPDPTFWTVRSGDTEGGVSVFRLDEEYDTGPILGQERFPLTADETARSLGRRCDRLGLRLLVETLRTIERGAPLDERRQSGDATSAPVRNEESLSIDWKESSASILRLIHAAWEPDGGALFRTEQGTFEVSTARRGPRLAALAPGEAFVSQGRVCITTGNGAIQLDRVLRNGEPIPEADLYPTLFPENQSSTGLG